MGKRTVPGRAYCSWFNFKGASAAAQGRVAVGRRTQPPAPGQAAQDRLQPAAAGRADQRPRRRHAAGARRRAAQLRRLRRRDQPRPVVPRPHRHAHAGLRRRQPGGVVRGELPGLRGRPEAPARRRGRPAAPDQVPEVDAVDELRHDPTIAVTITTARRHDGTKDAFGDLTRPVRPSCHRAIVPSWLWARVIVAARRHAPPTRNLPAPSASTTTTPAPRPPRSSPSTARRRADAVAGQSRAGRRRHESRQVPVRGDRPRVATASSTRAASPRSSASGRRPARPRRRRARSTSRCASRCRPRPCRSS